MTNFSDSLMTTILFDSWDSGVLKNGLLHSASPQVTVNYYRLSLIGFVFHCHTIRPKKKGLCFRLHNQKNWSRSVGKKFFFSFFFYFEKFVSDKLQANLESVGVSVIFFFRHQYELSRDL